MIKSATSEVAARLQVVIDGLRTTARALSLKATQKPDTIRNIMRGKSKSPGLQTLKKIAEDANVPLAYLTGEIDSWQPDEVGYRDPKGTSPGMIDLLGYVGAGDKVFHFSIDLPHERVLAPPGVEKGAAAVVRGDSMVPAYRPGDLVVAAAYDGQPEAIAGKDCLVQIVDGPLYLKKLRRVTKGRAWLESYGDAPLLANQQIEWIAPIVWVKRG